MCATETDVQRWETAGRTDILAWVKKLTEAALLNACQRAGDNWQVMATPRATNQSETTSTGKPMMLV